MFRTKPWTPSLRPALRSTVRNWKSLLMNALVSRDTASLPPHRTTMTVDPQPMFGRCFRVKAWNNIINLNLYGQYGVFFEKCVSFNECIWRRDRRAGIELAGRIQTQCRHATATMHGANLPICQCNAGTAFELCNITFNENKFILKIGNYFMVSHVCGVTGGWLTGFDWDWKCLAEVSGFRGDRGGLIEWIQGENFRFLWRFPVSSRLHPRDKL